MYVHVIRVCTFQLRLGSEATFVSRSNKLQRVSETSDRLVQIGGTFVSLATYSRAFRSFLFGKAEGRRTNLVVSFSMHSIRFSKADF